MPTHTINYVYATLGNSISAQVAITDNEEVVIDTILAPAATNIEIDVAIVRSIVKSFMLYCTGDCTVKTNSSGSPTETITLIGNIPVICPTLATYQALISADVTKIFLTSTPGGNFSLRLIKHSRV